MVEVRMLPRLEDEAIVSIWVVFYVWKGVSVCVFTSVNFHGYDTVIAKVGLAPLDFIIPSPPPHHHQRWSCFTSICWTGHVNCSGSYGCRFFCVLGIPPSLLRMIFYGGTYCPRIRKSQKSKKLPNPSPLQSGGPCPWFSGAGMTLCLTQISMTPNATLRARITLESSKPNTAISETALVVTSVNRFWYTGENCAYIDADLR